MTPELLIIGRIETPYRNLADCPRNIDPEGPECRLRLDAPYVDGLLGLDAGQTILILYWLGAGDRHCLRQHSRRTGKYAGVFALRSPNRPNPIGAALLPIVRVEEDGIVVRGLDCLDGTALLDIKPAIQAECPDTSC